MWRIVFTKQAQKDAKKIAHQHPVELTRLRSEELRRGKPACWPRFIVKSLAGSILIRAGAHFHVILCREYYKDWLSWKRKGKEKGQVLNIKDAIQSFYSGGEKEIRDVLFYSIWGSGQLIPGFRMKFMRN